MKAVGILLTVLLVAGCSSTSQPRPNSQQYCHTSQTIETVDREQVSSRTTVDCTDDEIRRMKQTRMGISSKCKEYRYEIMLTGKLQERRGYACQKFNGDWEIVPHPSSFR